MLGEALPDVNQWLVNNGYVRDTTKTHCFSYAGSLKCNHIDVPIEISFTDLSFQELPNIYLLEPRPTPLCRPLPHVEYNNKLCYLDAETYRVDPYRPVQTIVNLLDQAKQVLIESLSGKNVNDVGYEFSAYWVFKYNGVALSKHQSGDITKYNHITYISPTGKKRHHIVVGVETEIVKYRDRKNGKLIFSKNKNALWIDVSKTALLPYQGNWPPVHFKGFYTWLNEVDENAAKKLKYKLGTKEGAKSRLLIILNTVGGLIGVEVKVPITFTQNPSRYCKQLLIDKGNSKIRFKRVVIDDLTSKFITTRNLLDKNLSSKKIILIGCGTIGGYLSRLLVQAGAGQGKGQLRLFDGQLLSSGNLGRHYLDENYLYENKAEACLHKLQNEFHSVDVKSFPREFDFIKDIRNADLLIDATGREPFSLSLNEKIIQHHKENRICPDALYIWIDGNGFCGRTLYYNGKGGCYRCMQDLSGKDKFPPLKSDKDLIPMTYQCGESYVRYPPSISVQAAAMGLEKVLEWVNGNVVHHFSNRRFHKKAREHKDQNLTITSRCPACQK